MEALSSPMYEFTPETVGDIRKMYNLDGPGRMEEAIDILDCWVKQSHFRKKVFSREYLERVIIRCKGSVERAKSNIDRLCTLRSQIPKSSLEIDDTTYKRILTDAPSVALPKFAANYDRVFLIKCSVQQNDPTLIQDFYKYSVAYFDYQGCHDYFDGLIALLDFREMSIADMVASINPLEFKLMVTMYIEGYSLRIKGIHIVTPSKLVDLFVKLLKQVVSPKIRERLYVHKTIEELYDVVPREILPVEYGGKEKSLRELQENWCAVLKTEEHKEFMRQMNESAIEESCSQNTNPNSDSMGLPGTFRKLAVD